MATPTSFETLFLQLVNQARSDAGARPLSVDGELLAAARGHDEWMDATDTFSHTGVNGSDPGDRMEAAGYGAQGWGENIAYVSGTLSEATVRHLHALLMDSPGHRANIERAGFEEVGIGLKQGTIDGRAVVFVTQAFGTPNAQERAEADDAGTVVATPTPPSTPLRKTFTGNEGHNKLVGNAAANILKGKGGNDKLNGNGGKDLLFGGDGRDTFVFDKTHEANGDRIADFDKGWDKINLRGIDANTEIAGNQAFTFLGKGAYSGKAGELKSYVSGGKTYIAGDTNGDFVSDFKIKLAGLHTFSAGDFAL
jgi:hypothetical protein